MELKVKDNTETLKINFEKISSITNKVGDKTLGQLEKEGIFVFPELLKDAADIAEDQVILKSWNDSYRTSNMMGFLGCGQERLIIESRFSTGKKDYFFQYLLELVLDFPNVLDLHTNANSNYKLFNLLVFLFPHYLGASMRKGIYKTYVRTHYNDGNVKGAIDIARHINLNTPFLGKVAYNQREFSYDNYLMELIRHTIEFIKKKSFGNQLLRKVSDEVSAVIEVTTRYEYYHRRKIIDENKKSPVRHAYYHEYRALQRLCIMILQHEKQQIDSGPTSIHGILFDGAWLWEEYMHTLIGDRFYHPMNKGGGGAQQLFSADTGRNVGLIYPDFLSRDVESRVIADAKYKPIENIRSKDYLQVLAYMFRFDAKQGYYLYPERGEVEIGAFKLNSGSSYEKNVSAREDIKVRKLGLKIPQHAENYLDFISQMSVNEEQFLKRLYN